MDMCKCPQGALCFRCLKVCGHCNFFRLMFNLLTNLEVLRLRKDCDGINEIKLRKGTWASAADVILVRKQRRNGKTLHKQPLNLLWPGFIHSSHKFRIFGLQLKFLRL